MPDRRNIRAAAPLVNGPNPLGEGEIALRAMFARIAAAARFTRTERFARALITLIDLAITGYQTATFLLHTSPSLRQTFLVASIADHLCNLYPSIIIFVTNVVPLVSLLRPVSKCRSIVRSGPMKE